MSVSVSETSASGAEPILLENAFRSGEALRKGPGDSGKVAGIFAGTVVDVRDSSGYIMRCPECKRVIKNGQCAIHAKMKGEPDLRTKAVIDDGTGACIFTAGREPTEALLGFGLERAKEMIAKGGRVETVLEEIERHLLGEKVEVEGEMVADVYGYIIHAKAFRVIEKGA